MDLLAFFHLGNIVKVYSHRGKHHFTLNTKTFSFNRRNSNDKVVSLENRLELPLKFPKDSTVIFLPYG